MNAVQHDRIQVRHARRPSLRVLAGIAIGVSLLALTSPARTDVAVPIALRLAPGRYERTQKLVHLITFDMSKTLKSMAGGRAADQTILEDRAQVLVVKDNGVVTETETNTRRFGGNKPKEKDVKERQVLYDGRIAPDGIRTPQRDMLGDAGDGALDQLPDIPLAPGQIWTFSRPIRTDRELGQGMMTYTDKLVRVEQRGGHRIAIIDVAGTGRITPASDMVSHGFKTATMDFSGTAEFDTTTGLPGVQHYTGKVRWGTTVMFAHIGVIFNDTFDSAPLAPSSSASAPATAQTPQPATSH